MHVGKNTGEDFRSLVAAAVDDRAVDLLDRGLGDAFCA